MTAISHILFPLDFSELCCRTAPYVEAMAKRFAAKVTLLSVATPFLYSAMGDPGNSVAIEDESILEELSSRLDGALVREFASLHVERVAALGDPTQAIVDFARANHVDLIMMPTHGYGRFRSLLLGSVTAKVLHDALGPVWTTAHVAKLPVPEHPNPRTILCAVDRNERSVALMKWAGCLSSDLGATLRLVHVVPGIESWPARQADRDFEAELRREAHRTIEALQETAGVQAPICIAVGGIPEGVREEARRHNADLVVIGRGVLREPLGLRESLGGMRSHAYGIACQSPCPVISV